MSIGSVIKKRREQLNLKQEDVAKLAKVTVTTYSKWENDKTEPKGSQIKELSKILNLSAKEICEGQEISKENNPLNFMGTVGTLQRHMSDVQFLSILWHYVEDEKGLIEELKKYTDIPAEMLFKKEKEIPSSLPDR